MRFVDGHCVARHLAALTLEVGQYIESTDYSPGTAGWHINASGDAEFNDGVFRGTVSAEAVIASSSFSASLAEFNGIFCEFGITCNGSFYADNPPGASPPTIGFFDVSAPGVTKRTVSGSTADQKVDSTIAALAQYGLIIDNTT